MSWLSYLSAIPGKVWRKYFGEPVDPMNPRKPYFWYRQPWHLMTGALAGGAAMGANYWHPIAAGVVGGLYFGVMAYMEGDDKRTGQTRLKTLVDWMFHALGFACAWLI